MTRVLTYDRPIRSSHHRGVAMVLVLIALAMATVIGLSFLNSQSTTTGIAQNVGKQTHARGIAESALEMTIDHLRSNANWRNDKANGVWIGEESENNQLDGGTFTIVVQDGTINASGEITGDGDLANNQTDNVVITAIGYYQGVAHSIRAQVTPASSGPQYKVLFILDGSTPSTGETARISLLESFGYTVNTISSNASQSAFDTQFVANDAVYINALVEGVADKLVNAGIGIVTEQTDTYSTLGFSTGYSTYSHTTIDITNTSHKITSSLSSGDLAITSSTQGFNKLSGMVGVGVTTLAQQTSSSNKTFATLAKGSVMSNGLATSGRRVALPWGNSEFDITSLNTTGKELLKSAVNWAAATPSEGGGPWTGLDIGYNSPAGSNTYDAGVFTVKAAGSDIWGNSDQFRFIYMPVTGNGELIARVTSISDTNGWAKAGVMVRESLEDNSRHVMTVVTRSSGVAYQRRVNTGGSSDHTYNSGSAPYWVKVVRNGDQIRGYLSTSGNEGTWNAAGDAIILSNLPETAYFGLCLTSHNSGALCTATIDNLTLNGLAIQEEEDDEQASPQLIVEYEFNEVIPPAPVKLHQWKLDEATGSSGNSSIYGLGASAGGEYRIASASVDSYDSSQGEYNVSKGASAKVTLNSTSCNKLYLDWGARIYGDALIGSGGDVDSVIYTPHWSNEPHISGASTVQDTNTELPTNITLPSGLPSKGGNYTYNHWQPQTISGTYNLSDVRITSGSTVNVSGDMILVCDRFTVDGGAHLVIPDGASLTVYARCDVKISGGASVNAANSWSYTTTQTDRFKLYCLNQQDVVIDGDSVVVGFVYSTHNLQISGSGKVFGAVGAACKINMYGSGYLHVDQALASGGSGGGGSTNVVSDEQGVSDGIYHGGPTGLHDGPVGTSVYFDGTNDYVEIPHNDNMLLNAGTVSAWVKPTSLCGQKAFFSKDSTNYDSGGHLTMWVWDSKISVRLQSTTNSYWVDSASISANNWYHVVFSWGDGGMKLYINGQLADTNNYSGGLANNSGGNGNYEPIVLGASSWDSGNLVATPLCDYFKGYIDDVRIYDQGFEQVQAQQLYNGSDPSNGSTGYLVEDTSNFGSPLNLYVGNTNNVTWIDGGGLQFNTATNASSPSEATKIHSALSATNKMTLEVKFQTSSVNQSGPANLISYAGDSYARNFTFAQSDQEYLMRLRTSQTNANGSDPIDSGDVLDTDTVQHVVVTYDGEQIKLYRNASTTPEVTSAREGTFSWDNAYRLILGNEEGNSNPWLGKLFRFTVYDQALNKLQVKDLFDGNPPGNYEEQENLTFHVRWYENP